MCGPLCLHLSWIPQNWVSHDNEGSCAALRGDGSFCPAVVENARRWSFRNAYNLLLTCFSGPGALPIQMMTRGFCQAQLDKLHQIPEYLDVIADDGEPLPIQPQQGTSEEAPSKEKEGPPAKKTRSTTGKKSVLQQKTRTKVKSGFRPTQLKHLAGVGQQQAEPYNLGDMKQVLELVDFLTLNGGWELFLTPKDGQCMFAAMRRGMEVPEEYRSSHLRFQIIFFCVKNHGFIFTLMKNELLHEYGQKRISKEEYEARVNSEDQPLTEHELEWYHKPGPFSFYSYLSALMDDTFWGDGICLTLMSMMWQIGITVVGAEDKTQTRIRHSHALDDTHCVLVFAGGSHYLGACKYSFSFQVRRCAAMVGSARG